MEQGSRADMSCTRGNLQHPQHVVDNEVMNCPKSRRLKESWHSQRLNSTKEEICYLFRDRDTIPTWKKRLIMMYDARPQETFLCVSRKLKFGHQLHRTVCRNTRDLLHKLPVCNRRHFCNASNSQSYTKSVWLGSARQSVCRLGSPLNASELLGLFRR